MPKRKEKQVNGNASDAKRQKRIAELKAQGVDVLATAADIESAVSLEKKEYPEPQHSYRINRFGTHLFARFQLHNIPPHLVNLQVEHDKVILDTLRFSRKLKFEAAIPDGHTLIPEQVEASFESGFLKIRVPLADVAASAKEKEKSTSADSDHDSQEKAAEKVPKSKPAPAQTEAPKAKRLPKPKKEKRTVANVEDVDAGMVDAIADAAEKEIDEKLAHGQEKRAALAAKVEQHAQKVALQKAKKKEMFEKGVQDARAKLNAEKKEEKMGQKEKEKGKAAKQKKSGVASPVAANKVSFSPSVSVRNIPKVSPRRTRSSKK
jgi:hypothetical protein